MRTLLAAAFAASVAALVSCSSSDSSKPSAPSQTVRVDAQGGTIRTSDGKAIVEIPAGAVTESTAINITETDVTLPGMPLTHVYLYEPEGLTFQKPITVKLALTHVPPTSGGHPEMLTAPAHTTEWTSLPATIDGTVLSATTTHFSYYGGVWIDDADGGAPDSGGVGGNGAGGDGGTNPGDDGGTGPSAGGAGGNGAGGTAGAGGAGGTTAEAYLSRFYITNRYSVNVMDANGVKHLINFAAQKLTPAVYDTEYIQIYGVVSSKSGKMFAAIGDHYGTRIDTGSDEFVSACVFIGSADFAWGTNNNGTSAKLVEVLVPGTERLFLEKNNALPDSADLGAWSPDDQHFAFVHRRDSSTTAGHGDLYLVKADGTGLQRLGPDATWWMSRASETLFWSADGTALGWIEKRGVVGPSTFQDAHLWTEAAGEKQLLFDLVVSSTGMYPRPGTGNDFVFEHGGKIYVVNSAGSPQLISGADETASDPKWNPDGNHIGYQASAGATTVKDIWVVDKAGGNRGQVTFGGTGAKAFAFSPDGMKIVYASDEESAGSPRLYQMSGSAPSVAQRVQLSPDGTVVDPAMVPTWSYDSGFVAFASTASGRHIQIATAGTAKHSVDVTPTGMTLLLEGPATDVFPVGPRNLAPRWAPSVNRLAFVGYDSPGYFQDVIRVEADGTGSFPILPLTTGGGAWAPDGNYVVSYGWLRAANVLAVHQYGNSAATYAANAADLVPRVEPTGPNLVVDIN